MLHAAGSRPQVASFCLRLAEAAQAWSLSHTTCMMSKYPTAQQGSYRGTIAQDSDKLVKTEFVPAV